MISDRQLPPGWTEVALPDIADVNPPNPRQLPADDGLVSFIPMSAVHALSGRFDPSDVRPWSHVRRGYTRFQDGDVLFAKITPCMENGKAAVARGLAHGVGAGSTEFHVLRPTDALRAELLLHYVLQEEFRRLARAQMTGTAGQLRVPSRFLDERTIPLPPLPEQHRIVAALESYFTRLDDAVATLERVQRNLKRYRASVLKAAVEGRLVPTEADLARAQGRSYEPASVLLTRILAERRRRWEEAELAKMTAKGKAPKDKWKAKYVEPVAPDTSGLPELPEGWCWASVDQLTSRITSGSRDWTQYYGRGDSIFLMAQNVRPGQLDLSFQQIIDPPPEDSSCERSRVRPHDLLVTIVGANTGNVCRVPSELARHYVCQSVALMRPVEGACSHFLDVFLNSPPGQQVYAEFMYGQGRPHLSFDNLRETLVPLPPTAEQTRIREGVERQTSMVDDALGSISVELARLARLRQSILKWAFEGRLVDQDPTDEPVSVLLERIRAERASAADTPPRRPRRAKARTAKP